ncbi:hypothetical protein JIN77_01805 [Verrucomicrobiaceae bacterium R5-34]|uniref:Uncharacterized protein n=1 Tax=Oceaniferula flava TaxID=2800421 RepID=A0AAE2SCC7_9BACT|nr:hypothetical protein [Oceaniferula flavus]MBK1829445.1 hypothetical protein [Verrucomicrobiaceae bacterium R5-34]MBK1853671.1 hypothetical protein [Oceaniferula flavus]MBM1134977.1 hypothetical protein [Oceaniferula flavus]
MFNDLLTSAKGPGVIGLGLGLVVLIGFGSLAFLVLEDNSGGKGLYEEIKNKEKHVQTLEEKAKKWTETIKQYSEKREVANQLAAVKGNLKSQQALVASAEAEVAELNDQISATQQRFESYKDSYRLAERARAVGEKIPTLTIKNGKVYENVVIRRVFAEGMDIIHKNGGTLITLKLLPDDLLERFQFSDDDAATAKKNKAARIAYANKGAAAYGKSVKVNALKSKQNSLKFEIQQMTQSITEAQRSITLNRAAAERAQAKAREHSSKASAARAAGRHSMQGALATKEEARAANFNKTADKLTRLISSKKQEIEKARRQVADLEDEIRAVQAKKK